MAPKDIHTVVENARGGSSLMHGKAASTRNTTAAGSVFGSEQGNSKVDYVVPSRSSIIGSTLKVLNAMQPENVDPDNMRQMKAAVRLNSVIKKKSQDADLVIINLPSVPESVQGQANYMTFLEVLTEDINRILLIRGTGSEVITAYN